MDVIIRENPVWYSFCRQKSGRRENKMKIEEEKSIARLKNTKDKKIGNRSALLYLLIKSYTAKAEKIR